MIAHDSINDQSHRWTDGIFAYHWKVGGSALVVGPADRSLAGAHGWTFASPGDVQRVYVRSWSHAGPALYGINTEDPGAMWDDPAAVAAVVRELSDEGFTRAAYLFQFERARFLGNADGQHVLGFARRGAAALIEARSLSEAEAKRADLLPVEPPAPTFDVIDGDSLAAEIGKVLNA